MEPKLTPEAIERAVQLRAANASHNSIRESLLEEFGISVTRAAIQKALDRHADRKRRDEAVKRVEVEEARLNADAARTVAATEAAATLPADAKLIQLRLASLVGRSNGAWEGMSDKEKCSSKTWAKLEDLTLKYLFLKLRLGGALTPNDADMETLDKALVSKLESLAKRAPPKP
jgi:hypothetical protein